MATLTLLAPLGARADGPYVSDTACLVWLDNATNASSGDGILGAFTVGAGGTASWIHSGGFSTLVLTSLSADLEVCTPFSGLDNVAVGPRLEVRHKLDVGPYAPAVFAGIDGQLVGFDDPERSKAEGAVFAGYSQRFTDACSSWWRAGQPAATQGKPSSRGATPDWAPTLNWDPNETWRFTVTGGWRNGDTVAGYEAYKSPSGWEPIDPGAYELTGPWRHVATFSKPFLDYRVSAQTWSYGAAISPAVGRNTSVTLGFTRFETLGPDPYISDEVRLSIAHKY
jgi:hypothetical protein